MLEAVCHSNRIRRGREGRGNAQQENEEIGLSRSAEYSEDGTVEKH